MSTKKSAEHRYVSFFQSVLTIGIMSRAQNEKEAEKKAEIMMQDKTGINYCAFDQSPFEVTETKEWSPEFEPDLSSNEFAFKFNPDTKTKNVIATRLGKSADDLTDADLEEFVKGSIDVALQDAELEAMKSDTEDK